MILAEGIETHIEHAPGSASPQVPRLGIEPGPVGVVAVHATTRPCVRKVLVDRVRRHDVRLIAHHPKAITDDGNLLCVAVDTSVGLHLIHLSLLLTFASPS